MKKRIIVPTDFTKASGQAIKQAAAIASRTGSTVTLLHILDDSHATQESMREKLLVDAERVHQNTGVACDILLQEGNLFDAIPQTVCEKDYDLMVIGTHGVHGVRQMLFGADILKLVAKIPIPVLIVQEDSRLIDPFQKVVLPVGSHDTFNLAVDAVLLFAEMFDIEVHLYSIQKPGFEWPMQMLTNIEETTRRLKERGVRMLRIKEEQEGFSQGYARQTLKYAHSIGADTIWMIALASQEYYYMAKAYKEAMLLNEFHLPVLCAGGGGCN